MALFLGKLDYISKAESKLLKKNRAIGSDKALVSLFELEIDNSGTGNWPT